MKIKTKKDAQYFVKHFGREFSQYEGGDEDISRFVIHNDPKISMINGGNTSILREWNAETKGTEWYIFSNGSGWSNQEQTLIEDIIEFVWNNRKGINSTLSEIEKHKFN